MVAKTDLYRSGY